MTNLDDSWGKFVLYSFFRFYSEVSVTANPMKSYIDLPNDADLQLTSYRVCDVIFMLIDDLAELCLNSSLHPLVTYNYPQPHEVLIALRPWMLVTAMRQHSSKKFWVSVLTLTI